MEFLIDGYWKDDKTKFTNYIVSSKQADVDDDDNIFWILQRKKFARQNLHNKIGQNWTL